MLKNNPLQCKILPTHDRFVTAVCACYDEYSGLFHARVVQGGDSVRLGGECRKISHLHLVGFAFTLHVTQADQTIWTMAHSYNSGSLWMVLPKMITDQEGGKKHKEEENSWFSLWFTG